MTDINRIYTRLSHARGMDRAIVFLILDGLGDLPHPEHGKRTPLGAARTPHLDDLARRGICGLHEPVAPGVTPGSGPAHLALFGYPATEYEVGRGTLSALGAGFDLQPGDVAARGNFCSLDAGANIVTDRRAGRIESAVGERLCQLLEAIDLGDDVEVFVRPVKEHRFLLVLRSRTSSIGDPRSTPEQQQQEQPGNVLGANVSDSDPHATGAPPRRPEGADGPSQRTADLVNAFIDAAREQLQDEHPANFILLRGFASLPGWPGLNDRFGLRRCGAIADYPMYRGVARLLGMQVLDSHHDPAKKFTHAHDAMPDHDFLFVHVKDPDRFGEDGDFDGKVAAIEAVDRALPRLVGDRPPDVLVVTGDHSTPCILQSHSWHPVPVLLHAPQTARPDAVRTFQEEACLAGGLGTRFPAHHLLPLAIAHAGGFARFGA